MMDGDERISIGSKVQRKILEEKPLQ